MVQWGAIQLIIQRTAADLAMTIEQHVEWMAALAELSRRYPDWRFGQLVANVAGWADKEIWDVEDAQLLAAAQAHLDQLGDFQAASSCRSSQVARA
jgi:hypothetical protein